MKNTVITIDGHSGCGKSTLAKSLAKKLNFLHIDTGAMYRAISLFFLESDFILKNGNLRNDYISSMSSLNIDFSEPNENGESFVRLNGKNVEDKIRSIEKSRLGAFAPRFALSPMNAKTKRDPSTAPIISAVK